MKRVLIVFGLMLWLLSGVTTAQNGKSYVVIVNVRNSAGMIPKSVLSKIFLKQEANWMPVDQPANAPAREAFSTYVHGRSASTIKSYWQSQVFSGREVPPPEKSTDLAVIAYVRANEKAIGYVSVAPSIATANGVKVIRVGP